MVSRIAAAIRARRGERSKSAIAATTTSTARLTASWTRWRWAAISPGGYRHAQYPRGVSAALHVAFWLAVGLLVYAQAGYAALLVALAAVRRRRPAPAPGAPPRVSLIVAAYREGDVIAAKVADARALDYPRERLEVIVACDGADDATARGARDAGADLVLELPREGKTAAQDAAVRRARGEVLAFSDANARWDRGALRELVAPFADPAVGYVCGSLELVDEGGTNQEGVYWRYETALRSLESRVASVTAGNGAIYAVRRDAYVELDAASLHDL